MDPISHVLLGRTILRARRGPIARGAVAAAILGSLAPDLDIAIAPSGWDRYLSVHQIGTHAIVASPLLALGAAAMVRPFSRGTSWRVLTAAAWLGVVIAHLTFDLVSGSDMRLFWPVSPLRLAPRLLAMADGLALGALLAGVALIWRWGRSGALAALAILVAVLGAKSVSQQLAISAARAGLGGAGVVLSRPDAINSSLTTWMVYRRAGRDVSAHLVDARTGAISPRYAFTSAEGEAVDASRAAEDVARFLSLSDFAFATLDSSPDGTLVTWSDVRFCGPAGCGLTFAARLDRSLQVVEQVIQVGPLVQRRRP